MNFESFKQEVILASQKAKDLFGSKTDHMEFFINGAICTTYIEESGRSGPIYQYYQFDSEKQYWKPTHILQGKNWLLPEEEKEPESAPSSSFNLYKPVFYPSI